MSRTKRDSKGRTKAGLAIVGMSLLAGVGAATAAQVPSTNEATRDVAPFVNLSDEAILDVSAASFYVVDKENIGTLRDKTGQQFAQNKKKRGNQVPWSMKR